MNFLSPGAALGIAAWAILCGHPRADEFNWEALGGGGGGGGELTC